MQTNRPLCRQNPSREYVRYFGRFEAQTDPFEQVFHDQNIRFSLSNS